MGNIGMTEFIIVMLVVVLIFGVNKIPQLGKGLGEGIRNFKNAVKEIHDEPKDQLKTEQK